MQSCAVEARRYGWSAMRTLYEASRKADTWAVRVHAADLILSRGYGRPAQSIELTGDLAVHSGMGLFEAVGITLDEQAMLEGALRAQIEREQVLTLEAMPPSSGVQNLTPEHPSGEYDAEATGNQFPVAEEVP